MNAVFRLRAHDPHGAADRQPAGHAGRLAGRTSRHRYWPVFGIVSMDLPGSCPALPWTMVRM